MNVQASSRVRDRHATRHWRNQRVTAIGLVPLGLWFLVQLLSLPDLGHATVRAWIAQPAQAVLLLLFAWCALWHSAQGVQVVVEDYVSSEGTKLAMLLVLKFAHVIATAAGVFAVLTIALGN